MFREYEIFGHTLPVSGIKYNEELDWVFAAWRDQSSVMEFSKRPEWYQSFVVAAYRVERQMEAVLSENRDMEWQKKQAEAEANRMLNRR